MNDSYSDIPLSEHIDKSIEYTQKFAERILEDHVKYDSPFPLEIKKNLSDLMKEFCQIKHQHGHIDVALGQIQHTIKNDYIQKMNNPPEQQDSTDSTIPKVDELFEKMKKLNEDFENNLEQINKNNPYMEKNDITYQNFLRLLKDTGNEGSSSIDGLNGEQQQSNNQEIEMIENENFTIPIDPICKVEINIPVRNKICHHVYDKENFLNLFRHNSKIKCPVSGCSNKNVLKNDVEEDARLRILIEQAKQQQNED